MTSAAPAVRPTARPTLVAGIQSYETHRRNANYSAAPIRAPAINPNQSRDQRIDPIDNRGRQDIPQSESSPESQPPEPEPSCSGSPAIGLGREVIFGVEGTGSYGAGLASALRRRGIGMPKVLRTGRRDRRLRGKRWPVD